MTDHGLYFGISILGHHFLESKAPNTPHSYYLLQSADTYSYVLLKEPFQHDK